MLPLSQSGAAMRSRVGASSLLSPDGSQRHKIIEMQP